MTRFPEIIHLSEKAKEVGYELQRSASRIVITSNEEFQSADNFLTFEIESEIDRLKSIFDPIIEHKKKLMEPLFAIKKAVSAMMADYDTRVREAQREAHQALEESIKKQTEKQIMGEVHSLLEGETDEGVEKAAKLLSELYTPSDAQLIPLVEQGPKAAGRTVAQLKRYDIVDFSEVCDEFKITVIDDRRVRRLLIDDYEHAAEIVGGIRVYKVPSPRRKARR